ncbi:putative Fibronectin-binding protein [Azospirillaceae bacterium]
MKRLLILCFLGVGLLIGAGATAVMAADAPPPVVSSAVVYDLVGTDAAPGNAEYKGTVQLERKDSTVIVTWNVEGETYVGTGVVDGNAMAVAYGGGDDDDEVGIGLYIRDPQTEVVTGRWTVKGKTILGTERWTPRK